MSRILKTLLLVTLVVVWCSATWAAATPKYRMYQGNIRVDSRDHVSSPSAGRTFGYPMRVGATADPGQQVGNTYYDYQHNGSTGRQVDKTGNYIQVDWMKAPGPSESIRTVNWNRVSVNGGPTTVSLDNGGSASLVQLSIALLTEGQPFSAVRPGYCNHRDRPGGEGVVLYHDAPESGGIQYVETRLDLQPGLGIWVEPPSRSPNAPGQEYLSDGVIWPKQDISFCGSDEIHHQAGTWSGAANECWYWRGTINPTTAVITWDLDQPTQIDPVDAFITSVIEANGEEVTIGMLKQVNTTNADLVRYVSTDCGVTWPTTPENLTNFGDDPDGEGGNVEVDAVYDAAGNIHFIFNTVPASGQEWPTNLYHWSDATGLRLITSAGWRNTCDNGNITNIGANNGAGTNNLALAEPSISYKPAGVHSADELIYAIWTQYGPTDNDCATLDDQGTLGGFVNGEIYYSVSSNLGLTWDRPQNVTGTETPNCDPGDCLSESWVTSAAMADSGVYISYVQDTHAGPIVFGGGVWSECAYKVMAPEARLPVLEPVIAVTPTSYIELNANPLTGAQDSAILNIISVGNDDLTFNVTVTNDNGGASHVLVNDGASYSGSITAGFPPDQVVVKFDCAGLGDPEEYNWRLEVTSNDPQNDDPGEEIDVDLQVFSASVWYECVDSMLSTTQRVMQASSCLEMGDAGTVGTGFFSDMDSTEFMFSGSAVVTLVTGAGDTVAYHNAFMSPSDRTREPNQSFRAQSEMTVLRSNLQVVGDSSFNADVATGQASSTDTTIGIDYEIVFPQKADMWNGYYYKFNMKSLTGSPIAGVHYGVIADIDVTSSPLDTLGGDASENAGAGDEDKGWIGGQAGQSDSLGGFLPYPYWMAVFYIPTSGPCIVNGGRAAQVIGNPDYVHPTNAFEPDSIYALFDRFGDLGSWGTDIYEDTVVTNDDISVMLVNAWDQTVDPVTITDWGFGVAQSDISIADLEATIKALRTGANAECQVDCLIEVPGDVNVNGSVTSSDVIVLVNYVFKGGANPEPCEANGDVNCNGSVTSADIIYEVNYVFKGGAAPCDICNLSALECIPN